MPYQTVVRPAGKNLLPAIALSVLSALSLLQTAHAQVTTGPSATGPSTAGSTSSGNVTLPPILREGRIVYEQKTDIYRRMTDESMKALMPQFQTSKLELFFSGEESVCRGLPEEEDIRNTAGQDGDRRIVRFGGGPDDQTYINYASGKMIQQKDLGPKKYLIGDSLEKQNWKLDGETRTIKGYLCKKATTKSRDGKDIIAWYAEDIRTSSGPGLFGGLPGAILELNNNNAEILFTTLEITGGNAGKNQLKAPSDGKKISRKEFERIMEEQFGVHPGGGPTIRIIHN
ncbi:GLPGLI family protein [Flavitalea flava]